MANLVRTHFVRNHQDQLVTLLCGNQAEAQTGIPGGRLNYRATRLDFAFLFGSFDHGYSNPVLYRSARILGFHFYKQLTRAGIELFEFQDGCVANQFKYRIINFHNRLP